MMWDGETDALFVPASLLASPSRRNARRLNSREQPRQRRRLKCPIWKRAAACWPPMHPLLLKGAIGLEVKDYLYKLLRSRTLDKLIVASLLRHWDSDRTPHVRHVNLKVLPKLHTRGLFWARKSRPWSLLSSAGFARAPLSEWQGADSRTTGHYHGTLPLAWISCGIGRTNHGHVRIFRRWFGAERRRDPKQMIWMHLGSNCQTQVEKLGDFNFAILKMFDKSHAGGGEPASRGGG